MTVGWNRSTGERLKSIVGGQEEDRQGPLEAGFDEHLTKSAAPEKLLGTLAPAGTVSS
jgi:hypothetical protein